jgi:hypothetical protein
MNILIRQWYKLPLYLLITSLFVMCNRGEPKFAPINTSKAYEIEALEVVQAPSYTYVLASDGEIKFWLATSKATLVTGQNYHFTNAMEMQDFTSEELGKTFDRIYFINELKPGAIPAPHNISQDPQHGRQKMPEKIDVVIKPPEGGVSIADLYENRSDFENETVVVRGKVVKYNPGIMNRNWVHIQDGTGEEGSHDLTVTTSAEISVGEIGTFEGTIHLNKDFGSGYFYELIMEDASLISRKTRL